MRGKSAVFFIAISLLSPGCMLVQNGVDNVVNETTQCTSNFWSSRQYRRLAMCAWEDLQKGDPENNYSADYARGFKDGFADYLDAGGTGDPPAVPPRSYWKTKYQTPQGYQAIQDWFAGFRHGSAMAQESGFRQWITIPSSLGEAHGHSSGASELNENASVHAWPNTVRQVAKNGTPTQGNRKPQEDDRSSIVPAVYPVVPMPTSAIPHLNAPMWGTGWQRPPEKGATTSKDRDADMEAELPTLEEALHPASSSQETQKH
jgi:hypothetical protein